MVKHKDRDNEYRLNPVRPTGPGIDALHPFVPTDGVPAALKLHAEEGACFWCCDRCNLDRHLCRACGENLTHNGRDREGSHACITPCRYCDVIGHEHPADRGRTATHAYEAQGS